MPLPIKLPPVLYIGAIRAKMWPLYHNEFPQPSHQIIILIELQKKANVKRKDVANIYGDHVSVTEDHPALRFFFSTQYN